MHYYPDLKAQLEADIQAVLGDGCRISFGRLTKPAKNVSYGIVVTSVDRQSSGRKVREKYKFEIALRIPLPNPETANFETTLFALAAQLVIRLAPFDAVNVPDPPAPLYAGVANLPHVTRVETGDLKDTDMHATVLIDFSCETQVYQ